MIPPGTGCGTDGMPPDALKSTAPLALNPPLYVIWLEIGMLVLPIWKSPLVKAVWKQVTIVGLCPGFGQPANWP